MRLVGPYGIQASFSNGVVLLTWPALQFLGLGIVTWQPHRSAKPAETAIIWIRWGDLGKGKESKDEEKGSGEYGKVEGRCEAMHLFARVMKTGK